MTASNRIRTWIGATVALVLAVVMAGCGQAVGSPTSPKAGEPGVSSATRAKVRVAAAADLKFALETIRTEFAETRPDIELVVTYGSSGTFFQQLSNRAPFDLFLSADLNYPRKLAEAGLASSDDLFSYAVGRLVVWAANGSPVDPTRGMPALTDPAARKVAIANPQHAPYGVAAVAAMKTAGVYEAVRGKLVLGENVAQAAEFVLSGNAQVGVIALSLAVSPQFRQEGRYAEVALDSYPRIEQGGVVMADAQNPAATRSVKDYLLSEKGLAVLKSYGFFLPGA